MRKFFTSLTIIVLFFVFWSFLYVVAQNEKYDSSDFISTIVHSKDKKKIAFVTLNGEIHNKKSTNNFSREESITPDKVQNILKGIVKDNSISAIVLYLNTPGGSSSASDILHRIVKNASDKKPVYVFTDSLLASGGYYMSMPAKAIYATPQAIVGSIGVIMQVLNYEKLAKDKIGIDQYTFKSGKYKDIGNPLRAMNDEEKAKINKIVSESYEIFVDKVVEGRVGKNNNEKLKNRNDVYKVATGEIWIAKNAVELGLVDDILYRDELAKKISKDLETNEDNIVFVKYDDDNSFSSLLQNTTILNHFFDIKNMFNIVVSGKTQTELKYIMQ